MPIQISIQGDNVPYISRGVGSNRYSYIARDLGDWGTGTPSGGPFSLITRFDDVGDLIEDEIGTAQLLTIGRWCNFYPGYWPVHIRTVWFTQLLVSSNVYQDATDPPYIQGHRANGQVAYTMRDRVAELRVILGLPFFNWQYAPTGAHVGAGSYTKRLGIDLRTIKELFAALPRVSDSPNPVGDEIVNSAQLVVTYFPTAELYGFYYNSYV